MREIQHACALARRSPRSHTSMHIATCAQCADARTTRVCTGANIQGSRPLRSSMLLPQRAALRIELFVLHLITAINIHSMLDNYMCFTSA